MDTFTFFLAFALIAALELMAAQAWFGWYYRIGIPVAFRRVALPGPLDPSATALALEQQFKNRLEHPSLHFKAVTPESLAFRESLFENRTGFKYLPFMHFIARIPSGAGQAAITGYIDWYVLFAFAFMVYRSLDDPSFVPVALLLLVIFILSYITQARIIHAVASQLGKPAVL